MAKIKHTHYDAAEARLLRNAPIMQAVMVSEGARFDSVDAASVFFARELDHIKAKSYDVQYPELTALNLFPITHEADAGAETVTYYTYDKSGLAKIIDNYSTDLPRADVTGQPSTAQVRSIGTSYGYSVQEMRASRMAGKSLDSRKGESARYQNDNTVNMLAWAGDPTHGILGVLSDGQNIPLYTLGNNEAGDSTAWADKTPDEILADVNGMAAQVARTTKNVERPDTLCIPSDAYMDIATRRLGETGETVLSWLLSKSPYIKNIIPASELNHDSNETNPYAASGNTGVAFLFKNDENKLSLEIPMPYMQHQLQVKNLETVIPCESRCAGMIVYYPMSCLIAVGVTKA